MTDPALKLRTEDAEDLAVLAACLQDSLIAVCDMTYLATEQRFVFVANRFKWEQLSDDLPSRTLSGVTVEAVTGVRRRGFDPRETEAILSLLTLLPVEGGLELTFAGGAAIRLETASISVRMQDLGDDWPTQWQPSHTA
jgi:hypothetical protein